MAPEPESAAPACWLLLDVGNTRAKVAVGRLPAGEIQILDGCPTGELLGTDPATRLRVWSLIARDIAADTPLAGCVWSSVVPAAAQLLRKLMADETVLPALVRSVEVRASLDLGVQLEIPAPGSLGADRLANLAGLAALATGYRIAVDAGTAVTVDGLDPDSNFRGGTIAPGLGLGAWALHQRTAQLPLVAVDPDPWPPPRAGRTAEALRAGLLRGFVGMVERLIWDQRLEWGEPSETTVFLTGGEAPLLAARLAPTRLGRGRVELRAVPDLVQIGLLAIARRQLAGPPCACR